MEIKHKKILITGGNGFIAKSLNEEISNDYDIDICNRQKLNLLDSQKVLNYIRDNKFDVVIHGATYDAAPEFSDKDSRLVLENNLRMFFNIARCNSYFEKMIYFGSGAEFGRENWIPKMSEEYFDICVPTDQYGYSKYLMNKHALVSNNIYNLRLFGLFGKYDDWRYRFISNACCKAVFDMSISMRQNARFDYLYIDDLVKIVKWMINHTPLHKTYNVCSGEVYDYKTLAIKILKLSQKNDLEILIQRSGLRDEYSGDNSRVKQEMSDINFSKIDDSILKLYDWYDKNQSIIDKELFAY